MKAVNEVDSIVMDEIYDVLDAPHRYQGYIAAKCPFHDDLRPSFFVYPDWFKCLSCGANGPTNTLLRRMGKVVRVPNPRAGARDPNPFSDWMRQRTLKATLKTAWNTINTNPGMGNYITRDRGIDEKYRKWLGIGYIDDWYTIPLRDRNGIIVSAIARKGRDNPSFHKYVLPYGTNSSLLYVPNWGKVRHARYLILTFGILDAITIAILGYPVASTISGKSVSPIALSGFRVPIIVIPDRREEKEGLLAVQALGWRGEMARIDWPEQCKDINDIWVRDRHQCSEILKGVTHGIADGSGSQHGIGADQAHDPASNPP